MNFDAYKKQVMQLARKAKVGHMVPNADDLYMLWQQGLTPEQVVAEHCTQEAQAARHNLEEPVYPGMEEEIARDRANQTMMELIKLEIGKMTDLFYLESIQRAWNDRMRALCDEVLKPGSDETITDLNCLDYIWSLTADRSWSSTQTEEFRPYALDYYLGRKVEHVWGIGVLVKMKKGYGIQIDLPCMCGKETHRVYAKPGCHRGGFCYVYSEDGEFLADLRNQSFSCGDNCEENSHE